jgi:hypothetical protein
MTIQFKVFSSPRKIYVVDFSDRMAHHRILIQLEKRLEPIFIHDVYSDLKYCDVQQLFIHSGVEICPVS